MSTEHATELKTHQPPASLVAGARVSGMAAYQALVDEAERDYEGYWGRLAKEFSDTVAKTEKLEVPVSYAMMEGYITAKVIVEAVRRQGARPTREGMVAALDGISNFDLGGYVVGYKPGVRTGSKFVELSIISGAGKIRQ